MRYELKFKFNELDLSKFKIWSSSKKNLKKIYYKRIIHNIYYDDANFNSAMDNIIGLPNREKYRLRWYEDFNHNLSKPLFEIKIKKNRLNFKETFYTNDDFKYSNFNDVFSKKYSFKVKNNEKKSINLNKFHRVLNPVLKNNYTREYFSYKNKVRLTLDQPCVYTEISKNNFIKYFLKFYILELKFEPEMLNYAKELTCDMPFNFSRFSKYIHGLYILKKLSFY